jgi:hypothetical protein
MIVQVLELEDNHSCPTKADVEIEWSFTSAPPICLYSLVCAVRDMHIIFLLQVSWKESVGRSRRKWSDIEINVREVDGEDRDLSSTGMVFAVENRLSVSGVEGWRDRFLLIISNTS